MIRFPIYIGDDAITALLEFCRTQTHNAFLLVADENTWEVLGRRVAGALEGTGADLVTAVLRGEVVADARYLTEVMVAADRHERTFIAVGSGTITDITRLVSHRTRTSFISMPTAPSVDGFASIGAPVVLRGVKQTVIAHPPIAIFGDLPTLRAAPAELIAAGFGDMIGKFTSLADWRLGALLWDEPYDRAIADRARAAVRACTDRAEAIGSRSDEAILSLMEGLIESGLCMLDFGASRPASGAEHHCSHCWEMRHLAEGSSATLHGAKVGVATIMVAERYEQLRTLDRDEVVRRLRAVDPPSRADEVETIRRVYGPIAESIIGVQSAFLNLADRVDDSLDALFSRIVERWDEILEIAATVPPPERIREWLTAVGAPITTAELDLSDEERDTAFRHSHYLRDRFTIRKLERYLDEE